MRLLRRWRRAAASHHSRKRMPEPAAYEWFPFRIFCKLLTDGCQKNTSSHLVTLRVSRMCEHKQPAQYPPQHWRQCSSYNHEKHENSVLVRAGRFSGSSRLCRANRLLGPEARPPPSSRSEAGRVSGGDFSGQRSHRILIAPSLSRATPRVALKLLDSLLRCVFSFTRSPALRGIKEASHPCQRPSI